MNPSAAHYLLLRRLRQQVRHHNGFGLVYLFSDYPLADRWLCSELEAHVRARSCCMSILVPAQATEAPSAVLQPLLAPGPHQQEHAWNG